MVEIPPIHEGASPIRLTSYPIGEYDARTRPENIRDEGIEIVDAIHKHYSKIDQNPKASTGYGPCIAMIGFGNREENESTTTQLFLTHSTWDSDQIEKYREVIQALFDTSNPETCDFLIFGGKRQDDICDFRHQSLPLAKFIYDETRRLAETAIRAIIVPPAATDIRNAKNLKAVITLPDRSVQTFETHHGRRRFKPAEERKWYRFDPST